MKKSIERIRVAELRSLCRDFPPEPLEDSESPDFLIRTAEGVLGLEVSGLYPSGGEGARQAEGAWTTLLQRVGNEYSTLDLRPVQVIVYWVVAPPSDKQARQALEQVLLRTVCLIVTRGERGAHVEYSGHGGIPLPPFIERLRVRLVDSDTESFWSFGQGGVVPVFSSKELQGAIEAKDALIDSYRRKCDRVWLVLLANHSYMSSWGEHSEVSLGHVYTTRFERVIVYRTLPAEVVTLRTRPPLER